MVARLAYQKAESIAASRTAGLVIGCDTVAECMGSILGKPKNRDHAAEMLQLMRGREHSVYSGLCLWECETQTAHVEVDRSILFMLEFSDEALEAHLDSGDWQGKAGAFGFQDGLDWLELKEGSVSNIVGLPMELLNKMLNTLGYEPSKTN
jgi:septum formation protein